jgi:hypothetical protein
MSSFFHKIGYANGNLHRLVSGLHWKGANDFEKRFLMAMTLPHDLEEQLRQIAAREQRSPEAVLRMLLIDYRRETAPDVDYQLEAAKTRLYARARRYWKEVGDSERLALTDAQLDAQFWGFDPEGIPRLTSDSVSETSSEGSLAALASAAEQAGIVSDNPTNDRWEDDFATHLLRYRQSPRGE